ncbi:MAG: DNA polymerase III subunit delta [Gammaproteobacteria bacterium]|nr:DNA polymerase III subunit delta [Gammaproteobacteria bacterium]
MQLKPEQVKASLERGLKPIYLVSGEEPLQMQECLDAVRDAARAEGFTDRAVYNVDASFDWGILREFGDSLSLFAERRIIDLRMTSAKPDKDGVETIKDYAERPNPDNLLLITAPRIDRRSLKSGWLKAVDAVGVIVQAWPIDARRLPGWVSRRARDIGLRLDQDGARLIAERSEGNLLACAQEIAKLKLLHGDSPVGIEEVVAGVTDSARFSAFDLVDCVLEGDARRTVRIINALREEGLDPLQVLGPLAWALRSANEIAVRVGAGDSLDHVLAGGKFAVWRMRKSGLDRALRRHPPKSWQRLIAGASRVDRLAKGTGGRDEIGVRHTRNEAWDTLQGLSLAICGAKSLHPGNV